MTLPSPATRHDDDTQFLRSWMAKPLLTGAVMPSSRALARAMANCVDPAREGPVIELGPGTGVVTEALLNRGVAPARLLLVEFNPAFCELLRARYPGVTVVAGDAYAIRRLIAVRHEAAAVISGLPLFNRPVRFRVRLLADAFTLLAPGAPFVQFTYAMVPPVPRSWSGAHVRAASLVWRNVPPARVFVYRRT
jgi:phosphatidylethanolamine/phosphatidyl-N-methylethanolamine N-methyltransferase